MQVRLVSWQEASAELLALRTQVFVQEQGVPIELEQDGRDASATHALAQDAAGRALGTGRLLPSGQIGRMAVVAELRKQGIGSALLRALLEAARAAGMSEVHLHAQLSARDFYLSFGFTVASDIYLEAGIEHLDMRAKL
jgi:predicted GNAT family N-acyltransferase